MRPFARGARPIDVAAAGTGVTISLFGAIGYDVTTSGVKSALTNAGGKPVTIEIDSGGGDAFTGVAVYNLLTQYPADVTVKVLGIAASAASVIAMGGDSLQIAETGFLMIHQSSGFAIGTTDDHLDVAAVLARIDSALALAYSRKTGDPIEDMLALMSAETWMAGQSAIDAGFADKLLPAPSSSARASLELSDFPYRKIPAGLSASARPAERMQIKEPLDIERILVAAGIRRRAAQIIAGEGFPALSGEPNRQAKEWQQVLARIDAATAEMRSSTK
jgi:ATP-dependent Clp protease protease subunit